MTAWSRVAPMPWSPVAYESFCAEEAPNMRCSRLSRTDREVPAVNGSMVSSFEERQ